MNHSLLIEELEKIDKEEISSKEIKNYLRDLAREEIKIRKIISFFDKGFKKIEDKGATVKSIELNSKAYAILRLLRRKDVFQESNDNKLIRRGIYGWLWNAEVIVRRDIDNILFFPRELIY